MTEVPFTIALAEKYDSRKHNVDEWIMSEKLDGMRCIWANDTLMSRTGHLIHAPDAFLEHFPKGLVLDGELWTGRGEFQAAMSILRNQKKDMEQWTHVKYMVFDTPGSAPYQDRMNVLRSMLVSTKAPIYLHHFRVCSNRLDLQNYLQEVEQQGGEGVMLREPSGGYPYGRTHKLLKVKTSHDREAYVISYETGRGKHAGRVGALICRDVLSDVVFKIGTGLSDAVRTTPPSIGAIVTYKYFELTKALKPRFPVFVREKLPE